MDISLKDMTAVGYNGTDLSKVTYNGATVWQKQAADRRTVRFVLGSSVVAAIDVDNGTSVLQTTGNDSLPNPGMSDFSGWFLNNEPYDFDTLVTQNVTLSASTNASAHDVLTFPNIRVINNVELRKDMVVFLRVDFDMNQSFAENISGHAQTIRYVLDNGGKLVIASGRGNFSAASRDPSKYDLGRYASEMSNYFRTQVFFLQDPTDEKEYQATVAGLSTGQILLLNNLDLFQDVERKANEPFGNQLAEPIDVYINDAPVAFHRTYTSVVIVPEKVSIAALGFAAYDAYCAAYGAFHLANRPMTAIVGGDSADFMIVNGLINMYDTICLTGGLACLFLAAQGYPVNEQTYNPAYLDVAREILSNSSGKILLPGDLKVAPDWSVPYPYNIVAVDQLTAEQLPVDIGTLTEQRIYDHIRKSATVLVWRATGELRGGATYIMQGLAETDTPLQTVITTDMAAVTKLLGIENRFPMDLTYGAWSQYVESGGTSIPAGIQVILNKN